MERDATQELPPTVAVLGSISFFRYLTDPDLLGEGVA
jgi:hypothetical protein